MAVGTIVFGIAFELLGRKINEGRVPEGPNDWVFVILNTAYGLARIIFAGYGLFQLIPYLALDSNDRVSRRREAG